LSYIAKRVTKFFPKDKASTMGGLQAYGSHLPNFRNWKLRNRYVQISAIHIAISARLLRQDCLSEWKYIPENIQWRYRAAKKNVAEGCAFVVGIAYATGRLHLLFFARRRLATIQSKLSAAFWFDGDILPSWTVRRSLIRCAVPDCKWEVLRSRTLRKWIKLTVSRR
jgi:hypothetical protein